jgi:hypothetical protein
MKLRMNTCTFVELPEENPPRSRWVRGILVLGHLAIIVALLAFAHSHRPEPAREVASGRSILESLRAGDAASTR